MAMKCNPAQSDLFREPDEPEPAGVEHEPPEENEMRAYARRVLAERKAKQERDDGGAELCND